MWAELRGDRPSMENLGRQFLGLLWPHELIRHHERGTLTARSAHTADRSAYRSRGDIWLVACERGFWLGMPAPGNCGAGRWG
jgi:hypothetical protein